VSHSYWSDVALTWHLMESVKNFNGIWRQWSICNYCLPQWPPMNFLNHREWKIIWHTTGTNSAIIPKPNAKQKNQRMNKYIKYIKWLCCIPVKLTVLNMGNFEILAFKRSRACHGWKVHGGIRGQHQRSHLPKIEH
jgi:hypothetical protein